MWQRHREDWIFVNERALATGVAFFLFGLAMSLVLPVSARAALVAKTVSLATEPRAE